MLSLSLLKFISWAFISLWIAGNESSEYNKVERRGWLRSSLQEDGAWGWPNHIRDGETTKAHKKWENAVG